MFSIVKEKETTLYEKTMMILRKSNQSVNQEYQKPYFNEDTKKQLDSI